MSREERIRADFAFHRRIVELAGNALILNVLAVSQEMVAGGIRDNWRRSRGKKIDTRAAHPRIVAALRSHDPDSAQKAMLEHIRLADVRTGDGASRKMGRSL